MFCKAKSAKKQTFLHCNFRPLPNENVPIWDNFFPLLFPKDSESLKILDIQLREVGAKRRINGTSKVNRQTDNCQTDRQTAFWLIESIGPEGRCFENEIGDENRAVYFTINHWNVIFPKLLLLLRGLNPMNSLESNAPNECRNIFMRRKSLEWMSKYICCGKIPECLNEWIYLLIDIWIYFNIQIFANHWCAMFRKAKCERFSKM